MPRLFSPLPLITIALLVGAPAQVVATSVAEDGDWFDFCYGRWTIQNQRLLRPLSGDVEWEAFEASSECRPVLGGMGNIDEFTTPHRPGFVGMSLRLFNPATRQWQIYWVDNRSGVLQPPVSGRVHGSEAVFEGDDEFAGRSIKVRYRWSQVDTATPRWEQAFSADGGVTWETNWVMDFRRADGQPLESTP